MKGHTRY